MCFDYLTFWITSLLGYALTTIKEAGVTHILHELAADGPNLFAEGGAEHHALLLMRGQSEDVLDVTSHI